MRRKDWATLMSLMAAQTTLILGIGAFGFHRLETRMDRMENRMEARMDRMEARMDRMETRMDGIETRLGNLDRRVARIEGLLMPREGSDAPPASGGQAESGDGGATPQP